MIMFYSGTPGSGKSLHVASDILRYIKGGKNVIANFEVNEDLFRQKRGKSRGRFVYLSNWNLMNKVRVVDRTCSKVKLISPIDALYGFALNFHSRNAKGQIIEDQTLLVLDEAQLLFNSRTWQDSNRMEWGDFFTQHRKYGYEVIIISQMERLIDRQIRGLFELEVNHKKIMHYKMIGALLSMPFRGKLFLAVTHWRGVSGKDGVVGSQWFVGNKKLYSLYDSYKIFERITGD